jgi:hypothetical protein
MKKSPNQILRRFYRRQLSNMGINGQTLALGAEGMLCTLESSILGVRICCKRLFLAAQKQLKKDLTIFIKEVS